jgi:sec-independent protein translocase protein TatA
MGGFSLWHWIIVLVVVLVLFGRGRISEVMGDFGKGIKSFKQGLNDDDKSVQAPPSQIPQQPQVQQPGSLNAETVVDPANSEQR